MWRHGSGTRVPQGGQVIPLCKLPGLGRGDGGIGIEWGVVARGRVAGDSAEGGLGVRGRRGPVGGRLHQASRSGGAGSVLGNAGSGG